MVQILEAVEKAPKRPSFLQSVMGGLAQGTNQAVQQYQKFQQESQLAEREQKAKYQQLGIQHAMNLQRDEEKNRLKYEGRKDFLKDVLPEGFSREGQEPSPSEFGASQREPEGLATRGARGGMEQPQEAPKEKPKTKYYPQSAIDKLIAAGDNQTAKTMLDHNKSLDKKSQFDERQATESKKFHHQESAKFYDALKDQANNALMKNRALDKQLSKVDDISWKDKVVSNVLGGTRWENLFKSKNAQEFDAYSLPQLAGLRELLGGVLSDSDIRLIMQKVVTASKDPETNKAIGEWLKLENNIPIQKAQIADELRQANGGYNPSNFRGEIDRVFNERYGNTIQQVAERVKGLNDDPNTSLKFRRIVPPGTQLSNESIKSYFEMSGGDPELATQMAKEDGYDVPD